MIPTYELQLQEARQDEDGASLALIHNLNVREIASYVNKIKEHIGTLGGEGGGTITQQSFNQMLLNARSSVTLLAGMTDGQTIEFNGYQLKRIGNTKLPVNSVTFEITDIDVDRNTDFRKLHVFVKSSSGQSIYMPIETSLSNIQIFFSDKSSVASTQQENATDPNNKNIILL